MKLMGLMSSKKCTVIRQDQNHLFIVLLFGYYPEFREHFLKLKTAGIIDEGKDGLKWNRDNIAAAEYFDHLDRMEGRQKWALIQKVFGLKRLCQQLYNHREKQGKPSKHFVEIKALLGLEAQEENTDW